MSCLHVSLLVVALGSVVPGDARSGEAEEPGSVVSTTTDALGNLTRTWTSETHGIILGQAKLVSVTTRVRTERVDGSVTETDPYTVAFEYGEATEEPESGRLVGARLIGEVHSTTTDAFGGVTESWSTQTYDIILGQAKLASVATRSEGRSPDGAVTLTSPRTVEYRLDSGAPGGSQATCSVVRGQGVVQSTIILGQAK
jgi:hypothetical protein